MGEIVQSRTPFVLRGQDKVKDANQQLRAARILALWKWPKTRVLTLRMAAQLTTGEVVHMPGVVRVERTPSTIELWGGPLFLTSDDFKTTHIYLATRHHELISKKVFEYSRELGQFLQVRVAFKR
jgi:hypothetical protein